MPVTKDPSGQRSVQVAVEVPGTPEEVWRAIATGPGISSWFVPSTVEERQGGAAVSHFGPGDSMDSVGRITEWQPPARFAVETTEGPGPVATEWTVEAKSGGTCIVRVVHRWFASADDWDGQFEMAEHGWAAFFRILKLYLAHFRGQPGATFQLMPVTELSQDEGWSRLTGLLGLAGAQPGQRVRNAPDAPTLAGIVEHAGPPDHPELLMRLDQPAPGLAHVFALPMGKLCFPLRFYLYGPGAAAAVAREEPLWQAWTSRHFG